MRNLNLEMDNRKSILSALIIGAFGLLLLSQEGTHISAIDALKNYEEKFQEQTFSTLQSIKIPQNKGFLIVITPKRS